MIRNNQIGMIHGRFQPFHIGHLEYLTLALRQCTHLVVGITNPEPSELVQDSASPHRHLPKSNPFSYFQRTEMIRRSLLLLDYDLNSVSFTPFHLFSPEKWSYFLPNPINTVQFLRIFSDWERKKAAIFEEHGFSVEILDIGVKKLTEGSHIRELINNNEKWSQLVPLGTKQTLDDINSGLL